MPWYQCIKAQSKLKSPIILKVDGGAWGLACNAIHFLDLLGWWSGETLLTVNTDSLDTFWTKAKRLGNWEIGGTLEAKFSGGSRAILTSNEGTAYNILNIDDGNLSWKINEAEGIAMCSDGSSVSGTLLYQSEITAPLVDTLLDKGECHLPSLEESAAMHKQFLNFMLRHWHIHVDPKSISIPIT